MHPFDRLLNADRPYLTDGGMETWLFFQQGFEAPEFAAIMLMDDERACAALTRYFDRFMELAEEARAGFVLDTNSWRGCVSWAPRLGISEQDLLRLSARAAEFAHGLKQKWRERVPEILVSGAVGPAGDGYRPEDVPSAATARELHLPQIETLARAGVEMIEAITMTNIGEAVGVTRAAAAIGLPAAISFTVETDATIPTGEPLGEAIAAVDDATGGRPAYYMVNCAHPEHFRDAIARGGEWVERIGGIRANASRLSHAELEACTELDEGDPEEFGQLYRELAPLLPNLRVVGGCCGTDYRHIGCVSRELLLAEPA